MEQVIYKLLLWSETLFYQQFWKERKTEISMAFKLVHAFKWFPMVEFVGKKKQRFRRFACHEFDNRFSTLKKIAKSNQIKIT